MIKFGLIGKKLGHSFSETYFTEKFKKEAIDHVQYQNFEIENIDEIDAILEVQNIMGLNITIPYKEEVLTKIEYCTKEVLEIGAANCLKRLSNGSWKAYNTDVFGFEQSLKSDLKPSHKNALVLGTGGAAKAIIYVLNKLGINFLQVSRSAKKGMLYSEVNSDYLSKYTLIINTTPLGTFPNVDQCPPLPYTSLNQNHYLYDLVYNPKLSLFLSKGKEQQSTIKNGLEMLHLQAEKSWEIWNNPENRMI